MRVSCSTPLAQPTQANAATINTTTTAAWPHRANLAASEASPVSGLSIGDSLPRAVLLPGEAPASNVAPHTEHLDEGIAGPVVGGPSSSPTPVDRRRRLMARGCR